MKNFRIFVGRFNLFVVEESDCEKMTENIKVMQLGQFCILNNLKIMYFANQTCKRRFTLTQLECM